MSGVMKSNEMLNSVSKSLDKAVASISGKDYRSSKKSNGKESRQAVEILNDLLSYAS